MTILFFYKLLITLLLQLRIRRLRNLCVPIRLARVVCIQIIVIEHLNLSNIGEVYSIVGCRCSTSKCWIWKVTRPLSISISTDRKISLMRHLTRVVFLLHSRLWSISLKSILFLHPWLRPISYLILVLVRLIHNHRLKVEHIGLGQLPSKL